MTTNYDYIIIGSGFGGSVAAMRLAEKGYSVLIIEQGRRFANEDFPKSNWNLWKYLWVPFLRMYGFQRITFTRNANILSGVGVGGGSLVYANTLRIPPKEYFNNPNLKKSGDWNSLLAPFYEKASFMLGRTLFPKLNTEDLVLQTVASEMGRADTFEPVHVGVYFGDQEKEIDPYFNGEGPLRKGCIECAGCMTGCRENAKNTLDKNYLWFAQKRGAVITELTKAGKIEFVNGKYFVHTHSIGRLLKKPRVFTASGLIIAAGTLGTLSLLLKQKFKFKTLSLISDKLGHELRTNSETLSGITLCREKVNNGVAITSSFKPDDVTLVEVVKYPNGSGALKYFFNMSAGKGNGFVRTFKMIGNIFQHPLAFLRVFTNFKWAENTIILLVMQTVDNSMKMIWKKGMFGGRAIIDNRGNTKVPAFIKSGQDVLHQYAKQTGGIAQNIILEVMFNTPTTAHILGGCPMARTPNDGVIDAAFRVHGYPNMYITDGSVIQGNLGVNPSLTITAQAEYAMSLIDCK